MVGAVDAVNFRVGTRNSAAVAAVLAATLSGCTIAIPEGPSTATDAVSSAPPSSAAPTVVAGHGAAAGCQLARWSTANQGPLSVDGVDKISTSNLMKYLIPSVTESALNESTLPWVVEAGKKGQGISSLSFTSSASKDVMASTVWARMLGTADTGLVVSLACPSDGLLSDTTAKIMTKLSWHRPQTSPVGIGIGIGIGLFELKLKDYSTGRT